MKGGTPPPREKMLCTKAVLVDLGGPAPETEFRDLAILGGIRIRNWAKSARGSLS